MLSAMKWFIGHVGCNKKTLKIIFKNSAFKAERIEKGELTMLSNTSTKSSGSTENLSSDLSAPYQSGTRLISRHPQGMHTLRYIEAEVVRQSEAGYRLLLLSSNFEIDYSLGDAHRDFLVHDA